MKNSNGIKILYGRGNFPSLFASLGYVICGSCVENIHLVQTLKGKYFVHNAFQNGGGGE
jgi:CO dehydrogenase/acetyl-CoA synthase alpha subunit